MKRLLLFILYGLQVHRLVRFLWRKKIIILMYHGFTDREDHEGIENYQNKHIPVETFHSQLKYLKKYHRIISLNEFVDSCRQGQVPPPYSVVITMDDGYRSNYALAFPLLKKYGVPATISLSSGMVEDREFFWTDRIEYAINRAKPDRFELKVEQDPRGEFSLPVEFHDRESRVVCERGMRKKLKVIPQEWRPEVVETLEQKLGHKLSVDPHPPEIYRPLRWPEVVEMVQSGLVSIGSHTHRHLILAKCEPETAKEELRLSKRLIEERTGCPCRMFCYPNGQKEDFSPATKTWLKEIGYACGLTTVPGVNDRRSDLYELKRMGAPCREDRVEFVMNLYAVTQFFSDIKQFLLRCLKIKREDTVLDG